MIPVAVCGVVICQAVVPRFSFSSMTHLASGPFGPLKRGGVAAVPPPLTSAEALTGARHSAPVSITIASALTDASGQIPPPRANPPFGFMPERYSWTRASGAAPGSHSTNAKGRQR